MVICSKVNNISIDVIDCNIFHQPTLLLFCSSLLKHGGGFISISPNNLQEKYKNILNPKFSYYFEFYE